MKFSVIEYCLKLFLIQGSVFEGTGECLEKQAMTEPSKKSKPKKTNLILLL